MPLLLIGLLQVFFIHGVSPAIIPDESISDKIFIPINYSKEKGLMLILTRRPGETIHIGDDIEVAILSQRGDQYRVGITAPKEVPVHRVEVYQRIRTEHDIA